MAFSTYIAVTHSPGIIDSNVHAGNERRTNSVAANGNGVKDKLVRVTTVPISLKILLRRQLRFMADQFEVLAVSSPGDVLDEVSSTEGVRTAAIAMTRSITPAHDLKALWQLYRLFRKERPAIVHTHTPKAGLLGMLAARIAGVPVRMHTVAGLPLMEHKGIKRRILELVERLTYRCATKVYPNSHNLAQYVLENGFCAAHKIQVLGNGSSNGIDTDYFQPNDTLAAQAEQLKEKHAIGQGDFVFVFIGRLVKDKGIEELVAAFTALRQRNNNIRLLLVGPYEETLDPLSEHTRGIIQNGPGIVQVDFQQDVRPWLLMAQALVFPSYREGFPNVPMQAGCFHLPSIVTDINGCNEIVQDRHNGLLIPIKDTNALRLAMELIMTDAVLYQDMKRQARQAILDRFDQKHLWKVLLNEYRDQLKRRNHVS